MSSPHNDKGSIPKWGPKKGSASQCVSRVQHRDAGSCLFSTLFLEPQTSVNPHTTLLCSILPPLEPRVSGCKGDFYALALKRTLVCLIEFCLSLEDRIPADFHSQMIVGSSSQLWSSRLSWDPTILKGNFAAEISHRILNCCTWVQGLPLLNCFFLPFSPISMWLLL